MSPLSGRCLLQRCRLLGGALRQRLAGRGNLRRRAGHLAGGFTQVRDGMTGRAIYSADVYSYHRSNQAKCGQDGKTHYPDFPGNRLLFGSDHRVGALDQHIHSLVDQVGRGPVLPLHLLIRLVGVSPLRVRETPQRRLVCLAHGGVRSPELLERPACLRIGHRRLESRGHLGHFALRRPELGGIPRQILRIVPTKQNIFPLLNLLFKGDLCQARGILLSAAILHVPQDFLVGGACGLQLIHQSRAGAGAHAQAKCDHQPDPGGDSGFLSHFSAVLFPVSPTSQPRLASTELSAAGARNFRMSPGAPPTASKARPRLCLLCGRWF